MASSIFLLVNFLNHALYLPGEIQACFGQSGEHDYSPDSYRIGVNLIFPFQKLESQRDLILVEK